MLKAQFSANYILLYCHIKILVLFQMMLFIVKKRYLITIFFIINFSITQAIYRKGK